MTQPPKEVSLLKRQDESMSEEKNTNRQAILRARVEYHRAIRGGVVIEETGSTERPFTIYGTDIDSPPAETVEKLSNRISQIRGELRDIRCAYPLWKDWIEFNEGGLTCMLVSLAHAQKEMAKHHEKWGHNPPWANQGAKS